MSDERKPSLVDWLRGPKPINIEDVPWLVKDFDILYRTAQATLHINSLEEAASTRAALRLQIERLAPAIEQVQAVRRNLK